MEMIWVDENDNKPENEDASHNNVDYFNEDNFDLSTYDLFYTHKYFWLT